MIKTFLLFVCASFSAAALATVPEQTIDINKIKSDASLTDQQKAEAIALKGEVLLMPQSIDYAVEVFKQALALDPQNSRAGFYSQTLKPITTIKGFYGRVEKLIEATGEDVFIADYNEDRANTWPYFSMSKGLPDIKTDADARKLVVELGSAWSQAREFLAQHNDLRMTLHSALDGEYTVPVTRSYTYQTFDHYDNNRNPVYRDITQSYTYNDYRDGLTLAAKECHVTNPSTGVYHIEECKHLTYKDYTIDEGDIEAFREYATGHQIAAIMVTAYNTNGISKLAARTSVANHSRGHARVTDQEITKILVESGAGPLEQDHKLKQIKTLGVDALGGVKWIQRMQTQLCPHGKTTEGSRPGSVFSNGICLTSNETSEDDVHRLLNYVEVSLQGGALDVQNTEGYVAKIQFDRIFESTVPNLAALAPNKFDHGGNVAGLPDNSLNGVFVNGDANRFYNWK